MISKAWRALMHQRMRKHERRSFDWKFIGRLSFLVTIVAKTSNRLQAEGEEKCRTRRYERQGNIIYRDREHRRTVDHVTAFQWPSRMRVIFVREETRDYSGSAARKRPPLSEFRTERESRADLSSGQIKQVSV